MSLLTANFIGTVMGTTMICQADKRHQDEAYSDNEELFHPPPFYSCDWNAIAESAGFMSPWWPFRGGLLGGWGDGADGDNLQNLGARHSDMWRSFGSNGRLAFVGYTRDAYGSALGDCTVRLFRTSTDELVSKVQSDANGFYQATSPYLEAHYMTVHKTGTPSVAGASVDTIVPG